MAAGDGRGRGAPVAVAGHHLPKNFVQRGVRENLQHISRYLHLVSRWVLRNTIGHPAGAHNIIESSRKYIGVLPNIHGPKRVLSFLHGIELGIRRREGKGGARNNSVRRSSLGHSLLGSTRSLVRRGLKPGGRGPTERNERTNRGERCR